MPKVITVNGINLAEESTWIIAAIDQTTSPTLDNIKYKLSDIGFGPVAEIEDEYLESELRYLKKKGILSKTNQFTEFGETTLNKLKTDSEDGF